MMEFLTSVWDGIVSFLTTYRYVFDTLDIIFVAFLIYYLIKLVRDSRAEQLLKGILLLAVAYFVSSAELLDLKAIHYLLNLIFENGLIVLVVIFQPEIRRALEKAGYSRINGLGFFNFGGDREEETVMQWQRAITSVCDATAMLQRQKMGALIVLERKTKLGDITKTGTVINADATPELIANVFFNKAPLHDGAMILRDGKVYAAGCILPLSDKVQISSNLGTRHRAGLGMSENSDAVVVVVSEETGTLSVAIAGTLRRGFTQEELSELLEKELLSDQQPDKDGEQKRGFWRRRKK